MRQRNIVQLLITTDKYRKNGRKFPLIVRLGRIVGWFQAKVGLSLDQCGTDHRPLLLPSTNETKIFGDLA